MDNDFMVLKRRDVLKPGFCPTEAGRIAYEALSQGDQRKYGMVLNDITGVIANWQGRRAALTATSFDRWGKAIYHMSNDKTPLECKECKESCDYAGK